MPTTREPIHSFPAATNDRQTPGQKRQAAPTGGPAAGAGLGQMPLQTRRNRLATCGNRMTNAVPLANVQRTSSLCMKAIKWLRQPDSTLHLNRDRHQLRLQLGRLMRLRPSGDVGNALRDLQRLHGRGFPVPAMDAGVPLTATADVAVHLIGSLCKEPGAALTHLALEEAHIKRTMTLLDSSAIVPICDVPVTLEKRS